jgi:hypothetical protein
MGTVQLDTAGLRALAAHAERLASDLDGSGRQASSKNSWQPSVEVVNNVNALVAGAANALARRMSMTAEKLTVGSSVYTSQDETAASAIRTVAI